ncbi:4043_t:CDS:2, partial [Cetraspora pellucida]
MDNSQGSISITKPRIKRSHSYNHRQCGHMYWILMPLYRRTSYTSRSSHSNISFKSIPKKWLNDQEIQEQLEKIYQKASDEPSVSIKPRQLTEFWQDYCIWLSKCKNLEDSQSQREYWIAKEEFKELNRAIKKDLNQNQIPWAQFQPPIPTTTQYLIIGFPENDPISNMFVTSGLHTRDEFIRSATGIGFTLEFAFLIALVMAVFGNFFTFIISHSILNKVILFQNTIKIIQEISEFSLFKFIHFLNPSAFVNEFNEPPSLDMITDLVKFQFHQKQWGSQVALIYKLFYAIIARPTFLVLGLVALYIKLLLVSRSLAWIQQLTFDLPTVWKSLVDNPFYLITFLGLANNIAALYGIPSTEERQAFFENHRIHEYDFINALMHEFVKQNRRWKGFWNVALYTIGVN